jgi:hypothetical protein
MGNGILRTIDRIEGDWVVIVDEGREVNVPRAWFPDDAAEGTAWRMNLVRDLEAEAALRAAVAGRLERLTRDDDGGDFSL